MNDPEITKLKSDIAALQRQLAPLAYSNFGGRFIHSHNDRGAHTTHSQLIGALYPVLSDFASVSTYELQSPTKSQLGLTVVPDGDPNNGCNIFGLVNQLVLGVYSAGLVAVGFNGQPAPTLFHAVQAGNADTVILIWNTTTANYAVQIGAGSQSPTSGHGVLQVSGDTQKLWSVRRTPANSAATGYLGEVCFDDDFLYIYTTAGWKRTALAAF